MNKTRLLWAVGIIVLRSSCLQAAGWRVGIARTDITPKGNVWMAGYASRDHAAEGAIHPLWAKALVIEDQRGQRVAIVATDLIGFGREVSDAAGVQIHKRTGIKRERIVLSCSHTHCGPVIRDCAPVAYKLDKKQQAAVDAYTLELEEMLGRLVANACSAIRPAKLAFGRAKASFAVNRRSLRKDKYVISPNPNGPVDHGVPVLRVSDQNDRLLAVMFGYACHNTTTSVYQFNGDYAGFAQIAFEAAHPNVMGMFVIGCGGDSNPNPRGTLELAEQHGKALAAAVDRVLAGKMQPLSGPLTVGFDRVDLPFVDPPSKEELLKRRGKGNVYQQRLTEVLLKRIAEKGSLESSYPCPVQVIRFGDDLSLVALPGETVVDYALRLGKEFEGRRLWIAGYCNEVFAYLPSERVLAEGGYEGGDAMVYFGWHGPFQPGVEDRVVGLVKTLMDRCREAAR